MPRIPFRQLPALSVKLACLAGRSSNLLGLCAITFSGLTAAHAADVITTGGTTVLNTDVPGNRYLGNGILEIAGGGADTTLTFGSANNSPITELAMTSGGLITINTGITLMNGGFSKGIWTNNLADLTINGTFDMWDGNPVRVDALNGAGAIVLGFQGKDKELRVGVDNGSGSFLGNIAQANGAFVLRLFKEGSGTQTFNGNLSAQIPKQFIINNGAVELSSEAARAMTSQFLGSGNLIKSGAGALTISGASNAMMVSGTTTVSGGSLDLNHEISARANLVVATGTALGLNFTGQATVSTLSLGGSVLSAGIYNSTTHPLFLTGTGGLNVLNAAVATGSGTWSSSTGGFWNVASRWISAAIANGSGNTATIGAASAITVTLDRNETLGHLVFQNANHTLNAENASSLILDGTTPGVTVASGTSSRINAALAGTSGLAKEGGGTLTLAGGSKAYTGGTTVNGGRLVLADVLTGNSAYDIASGATLEFNSTGNPNRQLSGGTISGSGTFVKSGNGRILLGANGARQNIALDSGALIDVQAGVLRGEYGNTSGTPTVNGWLNNKADLNVASGAFFDIWDSNAIVDSISGAGTVNKGWSANSSLTFGVDNGSGTFSGTVSQGTQGYGGAAGGTFSLIKSGTGTQTFSGSNTYTGSTTIRDGTLILTGITQATSAITSTGDGKLGLDIGTSVTAAGATVTFTDRTVLVTGTPTLPSYTLLTASVIEGTPTLAAPAPVGYSLSVVGNQLLLVSGAPADFFLAWAGNDPGVLFDDDANNDGVDNGTAWFLGAANKNDNATALLPKATQNAGALVLEFDCLDAAARGTAVFEVQYRSDLGSLNTWAGTVVPGAVGSFTAGVVDFEVTDPAPAGGLLKVVATIPTGEAASGKLFSRIKGLK